MTFFEKECIIMDKVNVIPDKDHQQVLREKRKNATKENKQENKPNGYESQKKRHYIRQSGTRNNS